MPDALTIPAAIAQRGDLTALSKLIYAVIVNQDGQPLTLDEIAFAAGCSDRAVKLCINRLRSRRLVKKTRSARSNIYSLT